MNRFDAYIFDVDGTIWDSTPIVKDAWNQAFRDYGIDSVNITADMLKNLFGLPMDEIIHRLLPSMSAEERATFGPHCFSYEHRYLEERAGIVYDGFEEMICQLSKRVPCYIVSNCQGGYIELMYRKTGFKKYFTDQLCPADTNKLKAENIRIICDRYGAQNPVYIGDTQMDANACIEAKVPIIYAAYGFGKVEKPDFIIKTPKEILTIENGQK